MTENVMENYQEVFRWIPTPCVLLKESDFSVLDTNESFFQTTGISKEEAAGKTITQVFRKNVALDAEALDQLTPSLEKVRQTKEKDELAALKHTCPDTGKETYWSLKNIPLFNSLGELTSILICTEDSTGRVLLEKKQQELQAENRSSSFEKREAERAVEAKEEELKRSEAKFKALVQEGSDLIGILDYTGTYTFASESSRRIFGPPPAAFVGTNAFECIHPEDRDQLQKDFYSLKPGERMRLSNYRAQNGEGKWRTIESIAINLMEEPAVKGVVTHSRDITTMVEQALEIEQISERFQLAATATQDLIYDWDLSEDKIVRYHNSLKNLYGYSMEEVDEKEFWRKNIHPEDMGPDQRQLWNALIDKEEDFIKTEYRFRRADGSYAKVVDKGYIIRNKSGKAIRIVGAVTDISEITAQKEALRVSNNRFRLAMKVTDEMIYDWDIAQDIVDRSSAFEKIYGYKNSEENSRHQFWFRHIVPRDQERAKSTLEEALNLKEQLHWTEEYEVIKANGEVVSVLDRAVIIKDENGVPIRMVGAVLDVTASRKMLKDIRKQNEILKEIAWEQSHVVRAPLARLKGLLEFLGNDQFDVMSKEQVLEHIYTAADELDAIVRRIVSKTEKVG